MVVLNALKFTNAVPYIANDVLEKHAESAVRGYSPECLHSPGNFDVLGFLQSYLGLSVVCHTLGYGGKLLGMTAFRDGYVQVLKNGTSHTKAIRAGTVVLDSSLQAKRNLPRLRFTAAHEAAHWLLHRKIFAANCDHMEHQADFLASAILMPLPAVRVAYKSFFADMGAKPRPLVRGRGESDNSIAWALSGFVANLFGVSKRAALIRLEKLNAIIYKGVLWRKIS